jgi:uncharacterized membrane protein YhaH (DUF805 family)
MIIPMKQALYSIFIKDIFNFKESLSRKAYWSTVGYLYLAIGLSGIFIGPILVAPALLLLQTDPSLLIMFLVGIQAAIWLWISLAILSATARRFVSVGVPAWVVVFLPATLVLGFLIAQLEIFALTLIATVIISLLKDKTTYDFSEDSHPDEEPNVRTVKETYMPESQDERMPKIREKKQKTVLWVTLAVFASISIPALIFPPILNAIQNRSDASESRLAALQICYTLENYAINYRSFSEEDYTNANNTIEVNLELLKADSSKEYQTLVQIVDNAGPDFIGLAAAECGRLGYPILD